ncbi:hypothetical protein MRX96_004771 [Rhipicephalus microplus]
MKLAVLALCALIAGAQAWFGASMRRLYNGPDSVGSIKTQLDGVGEPLFLTPLIEAGQLERARNLSRVGSLGAVPDFPSYSGFLTVNKQYGNNLFFWFFPGQASPRTTTATLATRTTSAGTLHEALQQFFTLFDEYAANDFYATGESYAGKYVPAIAHAIDTAVSPRVKINLRGIAIGDGMVDPETMFDYADFLYQIGLVDRRQADHVRTETERGVDYIKRGRYLDAFLVFDRLINGDTVSQPSYFKNVTGLDFYYNFLLSREPEGFGNYHAFVDSPAIRKATHVGNLTFNNGDATESHLKEDIMQSVKPWLASLMDKPQYKAERKIWKRPDGNGVAGYVRKVGNFTQVLVRNAGHILPYDQPDVALDLITRFIDDKPFDA